MLLLSLCGCGAPYRRQTPVPDLSRPQPLIIAPGADDRAREAERIILSTVSSEFRTPTVAVTIDTPTREQLKAIFAQRGLNPNQALLNGWGEYAPPVNGFPPGIFLVKEEKAGFTERRFRVLHEWGHAVWQSLVSAQEWVQWSTIWYAHSNSLLSAEEGFANTFADWCVGKVRRDEVGAYFEVIRQNIKARGSALQRG